jgi:prolyl-tRNA editing enzyme YbaK/EbsC (Cys-tRNA(Pro) deacylase)
MTALTPDHVQSVLDSFNLSLRVLHFDDHTTTSVDAARVIGCKLGQIAKSMCLMVGGNPVLVVASGDQRIAEAKLARHFGIGRKKIKIATPEQCVEIFGYAPGGVPPVAHRTPEIPIIMDQTLSRWPRLYAAGGTPHDNFEVTFDQLQTITGGTVLDCVVEPPAKAG